MRNYIKTTDEAAKLTIETYEIERQGEIRFVAKITKGRRKKPDLFVGYATAERRMESMNKYVSEQQKIASDKAQPHTLNVGDILYSSWGHEQTNIDWYQVVSKTDKTITVREIKGEIEHTGDMMGKTMPVKDSFIGESFRRTVSMYDGRGSIKLSSYAYAYAWDGMAKSWTSYA